MKVQVIHGRAAAFNNDPIIANMTFNDFHLRFRNGKRLRCARDTQRGHLPRYYCEQLHFVLAPGARFGSVEIE